VIRAAFDYAAPTSVEDAVALLDGATEGRVLAGGQALLTDLKLGRARPGLLVDLRRVPGLQDVESSGGNLRLGAMITIDALADTGALASGPDALVDAVSVFADPQVRNRATLGGALANATPGADLPAVALACGATVDLVSPGGARTAPVEESLWEPPPAGPGPGEIIVAVTFPLAEAGTGSAYSKVAHPGSGYAVCGVAALVALGPDGTVARCRVAVAGAGPGAVRLPEVEAALTGTMATAAEVTAAHDVSDPGVTLLSDLAASADYRAHLARVLAGRSLTRAVERARRGSA
jgi:aerobic carbon-monoxide dehydrogenase medium subunit